MASRVSGRNGDSTIDEEAEKIIFYICGKGLHDPKWLRPECFASALGMNMISLSLFNRPKTASILFFGEGDVLIQEEKDRIGSVHIGSNTIVLNTASKCRFNRKDAIFHECFHYIEHRLFFRLQRLCNDDLSEMNRRKVIQLKDAERSPLEWIEWQARYGSQCLQMPRILVKRRVEERMSERKSRLHLGYKLQYIGKKLAREFDVPNFRMRNRMIHIGYTAAKGALNYVNGTYITPFAFEFEQLGLPRS